MLTYDPAVLERPGFSWSDTYPLASLDLTTKSVPLKSGESFGFDYRMKFLPRPPAVMR
jgi:hypothetical protein